jgi:hypothetical protein
VRRSSNRLPPCPFSDIIVLLCTHAATLAARAWNALPPGTVNCLICFSPDENSASRSAELTVQ